MKVSALIPVYNEEKTIESIIKTLKGIEQIDEIVVVNDGSSDNTAWFAEKAGAKIINLDYNQGKGAALQKGIEAIKTDIILMLDGDLIGLKEMHVINLLNPLFEGKVDMTVGVFNNGRGFTDLAQRLSPVLSGQRAVKKELIKDIKDLTKCGYGVEIALNKHVKKHGKLKFVILPELTHLIKEEKRGITRGIKDRIRMYWDILKVIFAY